MATGRITNDQNSGQRIIQVAIEKCLDPQDEASFIREALKNVAKQFAEHWLEENKDRVLERLNVDAIANMILLEVAKQTKDDILSKQEKE